MLDQSREGEATMVVHPRGEKKRGRGGKAVHSFPYTHNKSGGGGGEMGGGGVRRVGEKKREGGERGDRMGG